MMQVKEVDQRVHHVCARFGSLVSALEAMIFTDSSTKVLSKGLRGQRPCTQFPNFHDAVVEVLCFLGGPFLPFEPV